jgi:hypothetical protein
MTWMHKIRLRVLGLLLGLVLAAIAAVSFTTWPAWPVIGVAVATLAIAVNKMTTRLAQPVCWGCGTDISRATPGQYGVECPSCGSLTPQGVNLSWKRSPSEPTADEDERSDEVA